MKERAKLPVKSVSHMLLRSVKVDHVPNAADYMQKFGFSFEDLEKIQGCIGWTAAKELTKANIKKSKSKKGKSPWYILAELQFLDPESEEFSSLARLFSDFARIFSGTNQTYPSKGLKTYFRNKKLDLAVTDQDIVDTVEPSGEIIGSIKESEWKTIKKYAVRGEVLKIMSNMSFSDFIKFLPDFLARVEKQRKMNKNRRLAL